VSIQQSRFKFTGTNAAHRHFNAKQDDPDGVNHALVKLRGTVAGRADFGKVILIGCVCNDVFWRDVKVVSEAMLAGDWAKPFRQNLGVKARPSKRDLK
jgi:hypothetical protein